MPSPIEQAVRSITEDRRATYLFNTKIAADAVGCHPNKFNDWWERTKRKLIDLGAVETGNLAAELAGILALAEAERQRRFRLPKNPPPPGNSGC